MIDPFEFLDCLKLNGINFITGVPDSLLKDFNSAVIETFSGKNHIISANEGNAVALAAGHYISTGSIPLVYMQNSGLGNAVNPLVSLVDKHVYQIPMLLMIGWRGEPGTNDEPQHHTQGNITEEILKILQIPIFKINSLSDFKVILPSTLALIKASPGPVALLVSKDTFESAGAVQEVESSKLISRELAIETILDSLPLSSLIISTTGMISREVFELREKNLQTHDNDFLTVGSMGHASSIALTIAQNTKNHHVICLDGDGSLLMHMGSLGIIGQSNVTNLIHIVLNNGAHDSVGGQPTVALSINLKLISKSCGYSNSLSVDSIEQLKSELASLIKLDGPNFLEVVVKKGARFDLKRPVFPPKDNLHKFMQNLTEV
jgi:phosphonopyruvate decarboxylase